MGSSGDEMDGCNSQVFYEPDPGRLLKHVRLSLCGVYFDCSRRIMCPDDWNKFPSYSMLWLGGEDDLALCHHRRQHPPGKDA